MTTLAAGDTIFLKNGDQLTGEVKLERDGKLSLTHAVLGPLQLDSNLIQGGELSLDLADGDELSGSPHPVAAAEGAGAGKSRPVTW